MQQNHRKLKTSRLKYNMKKSNDNLTCEEYKYYLLLCFLAVKGTMALIGKSSTRNLLSTT